MTTTKSYDEEMAGEPRSYRGRSRKGDQEKTGKQANRNKMAAGRGRERDR